MAQLGNTRVLGSVEISLNGSFLGSVITKDLITSGSINSTGNITTSGSFVGYGGALSGLPSGGLPQGVLPYGSLTAALPQGVLPVGSIPSLTAYIPQGQLITGSLPNTITISADINARHGSFTGSVTSGSLVSTGNIVVNGSYFGYGGALTGLASGGLPQGVLPYGSLINALPQGVLPVGSIPSLTAYIPQGVIPAGSLINSLPQGQVPVGSLSAVLPQGVLPVGSIPSLIAYIPQGVIPAGSLINSLPQGVLPVGSIPSLTAYIPQGQLITGSLPNSIVISNDLQANDGSFSGSLIVGTNGSFVGSTIASLSRVSGSFVGSYIELQSNATNNLLRFNTDRAWSFKQFSTGANTQLALISETADKSFSLQTLLGSAFVGFNATSAPGTAAAVTIHTYGSTSPNLLIEGTETTGNVITAVGSNTTTGSFRINNFGSVSIGTALLTHALNVTGTGSFIGSVISAYTVAPNLIPQGVLPTGSIPSLSTVYIPQGAIPYGSLNAALPQGVLPVGSIPSLTAYIPQGVIPVGSLTAVLPQGVLPVGSIPSLTAYIPQGQLITGSLPNTIVISGDILANNGSFIGSLSAERANFANTVSLIRQTADNFSTGYNVYKRGNSSGTTGSLASGAELGYHSFYGWDGAAYNRAGYAIMVSTQEYALGSAGGQYRLATTPNNSTTSTVRLVINQDGSVTMGASNGTGLAGVYMGSLHMGTTMVIDQNRNYTGGSITGTQGSFTGSVMAGSLYSGGNITVAGSLYGYGGTLSGIAGGLTGGGTAGSIAVWSSASNLTYQNASIDSGANASYAGSVTATRIIATNGSLSGSLFTNDGSFVGSITVGGNALLSGNVGVGQAPDASYKLSLTTTSGARTISAINNNTGTTAYGVHVTKVGAAGSGVGLYVTSSGASFNYAALFDQGNVGIGNLAPSEKFDVTGNVRSSGSLIGSYVSVTGNVSAGSYIGYGGALTGISAGGGGVGSSALGVAGSIATWSNSGSIQPVKAAIDASGNSNFIGSLTTSNIIVNDGTASAPSIRSSGDADTGIFFLTTGNQEISLVTAGVARLVAGATGSLTGSTLTLLGSLFGQYGSFTNTVTSSNTITWNTVSGSTTVTDGTGYFTGSTARVIFTLPTAMNVGTIFKISGSESGGWALKQNANQFINFGNTTTTVGTTGSLHSNNRYNSVELVCSRAGSEWNVISSVGTIGVK